jgi:hypothetical protein
MYNDFGAKIKIIWDKTTKISHFYQQNGKGFAKPAEKY